MKAFTTNTCLPRVAVPVEAIDRIEVIRGPMSVLYGSGAFFGVINIITDDQESNSENIASLMIGSNQTKKFTTQLNHTAEELQIGITGSAYQTEGMNVPYNKMMSDPSKLSTWGLNPQSTTEGMLKDKQVYFNMNAAFKGLNIDMAHSEVERGGFLVQPTVEYSPSKRHSTNFGASYQHSFNDLISAKLKFSYLTTSTMSHYFVNEKNSYLTFGYNSDAYELELLSFIQPTPQLDITFGLVQRNVFHATNPAEMEAVWGIPYGNHLSRLEIDSRMIDYAGYTQLSYSPFKLVTLVAGIRLQYMVPYNYEVSGGDPLISNGREHYENSFKEEKIHTIPSLAILIKPFDKHTIKMLYGEALRYPPMGQLADILFSDSQDTLANFPLLVPSEIKTLEINYSGIYFEKFSLQLSLFYNDLSNLISQYFLGVSDSITVYYTSNKGKIKTTGGEFSLRAEPIRNMTIILSGLVQNSENKTPGLTKVPVPYSPDYCGYMTISYAFAPKIALYVSGNAIGAMYSDYDHRTNTWLGEQTKASGFLDAGIILSDLPVKNMMLNLRCTNVLNSEIHYPVTTLNRFADKGIIDYTQKYFVALSYSF